MREVSRMVIVLTVIAMVSAGVLSLVYSYTSEIIQANLLAEMEEAVFQVLPGAASADPLELGTESLVEDDRSTLRERSDETPQLVIFEAFDADGGRVGYAFVGEGTGYGGVIRVLVGINLDYEITAIQILEHLETPGLGSRIQEEGFRGQFAGKTPDDEFRVGRDIDNISGATVSATAVTEAVSKGLDQVIPVLEGGR